MSNKRSGNDYVDLTLTTGEKVKIHRVPQSLVRGVVPTDLQRPRRPAIEMKLPGGKKQVRPAKAGDEEWEVYAAALEEWTEAKDQLQEDVTLCLAFKGYQFPAELVMPTEVQELVNAGMLTIPNNPWARKAAWLRATVLAAYADELEVDMQLQLLSGVPEDIIDEMKANFRNSLLGQTARGVGAGAPEADAGEPEGVGDEQ